MEVLSFSKTQSVPCDAVRISKFVY